MAEGHEAHVKLTGDSSSLEKAASRSAQKTREFDASLQKLEATSKRANAATLKSTAAQERAAKAATSVAKTTDAQAFATGKLNPLLGKLNTAANAVTGSTLGLGRAVANTASAFGPWGLAISIASNLLLDLVDSERQAAEATRKHRDELRLQREEMKKLSTEKAYAQLSDERRRATEEASGLAGLRETEKFLEEEAARTRARGGKEFSEVLTAQAKARAAVMEAEAQAARAAGDLEESRNLDIEAGNVLRQDRLRLIDEEETAAVEAEKTEKRVTKEKREQLTLAEQLAKINAEAMKRTPFGNSPSFGRTGQDTLFDIEAGSQRPANDRPGLRLSGAPAIMRDPNAAVTAEQQRNAALRAIEVERAQELEFDLQAELGRIEREKQAQLGLLMFHERVAANDAERLAVREEQRQTAHEAELARIEAEKVARTKAQEAIVNAIETTGGVIGAGTKLAAMAAEATGASAKKQARVAQIGMGIQAMAIGALEVVKAAASYASLNIPQGIAHTAAAAVAFTEGGLLLAGKIGGSGGGASVGGGGGRTVGDTTPRQSTVSTAGNDSPIPGSPGPQAPRTGGGQSQQSGGATVIDLRGANFYGTGGKKEFGRFLDESLKEAANNRRPTRDR